MTKAGTFVHHILSSTISWLSCLFQNPSVNSWFKKFFRNEKNIHKTYDRKYDNFVKTPGWFLLAHPIPHDTTPTCGLFLHKLMIKDKDLTNSNLSLGSFLQMSGPPLSPWQASLFCNPEIKCYQGSWRLWWYLYKCAHHSAGDPALVIFKFISTRLHWNWL